MGTTRRVTGSVSGKASNIMVTRNASAVRCATTTLDFVLGAPIPVIVANTREDSSEPSDSTGVGLVSSMVTTGSSVTRMAMYVRKDLGSGCACLRGKAGMEGVRASEESAFEDVGTRPVTGVRGGGIGVGPSCACAGHNRGRLRLGATVRSGMNFVGDFPKVSSSCVRCRVSGKCGKLIVRKANLKRIPGSLVSSFGETESRGVPIVVASRYLCKEIGVGICSAKHGVVSTNMVSNVSVAPRAACIGLY